MGQNLFKEIKASEDFNFHLESKGILVLCKTQSFLDKEQKMVELSSENGMEASSLNKQELQKLEPYYELDVLGGAWYKSDWHSTPSLFMRRMKNYLQEKGVRLHPNKAIKNIKFKKKRIEAISTDDSEFEADEFVLAAGVWSRHLAKKVGLDLRLEAGKGYRIDAMQETQISMPSIIAESKVAVTPMEGFTRFAGTMELSGANHYIDNRRVKAIADSIPRYFKNFELQNSEKEAAQCGIRPLSPDGRPYIGKSSKCVNLTIATGHGMMGWTMGPSTGKLVTELISERNPSMDIEAFHPDRRF